MSANNLVTPTVPEPISPKFLLSAAEAARALGISVRTLARMVKRREIPVVRNGSRVQFRPDDLIRWIDEHRIAAKPAA